MQFNPLAKSEIQKWTLIIGSSLTVVAGAALAPVLPEMDIVFKKVQDEQFWVKMVLSLPALFIAMTAPLSGFLLDRIGRKPILIFSLILYVMAGCSGYFLESLNSILVGRAFLGIAVAGIMSSCTTLIADYYMGKNLQHIMGLQSMVMSVAGMASNGISGFLTDYHWQYPFLIYLIGLFVLLGVLLTIEEPRPHHAENVASGQKPQTRLYTPIVTIYFLGFWGNIVFFMIPTQLSFYLNSISEVSYTEIGLALSFLTLVSAITSYSYTIFKVRFLFNQIFMVLFLLLGLGYFVIAFAQSYFQVLIGLFLSGIGLGFYFPNITVWLTSFLPKELRGKVVSGLLSFVFIGQFISPIVVKPISDEYGLSTVFLTAGFFTLVIGLLFIGRRLERSVE